MVMEYREGRELPSQERTAVGGLCLASSSKDVWFGI